MSADDPWKHEHRPTDPRTFEASKAAATVGLRSLASLSLGAGRLGRFGRFGLQELQVKRSGNMLKVDETGGGSNMK